MTRKRSKPSEASPARGQLDLFNRAESSSSTALDGGEAAAGGISDGGASAAIGSSVAARLTPSEGATLREPLDEEPRYSSEVPKQAGGIPYQILYGIVKSLDLERGETLGIEHLEDVSITGSDVDTLIQVKNKAASLNDLDDGLWSALARWAKKIAGMPAGTGAVPKFVFATTAPINGSFPNALKRNRQPTEESVGAIVARLPGFESDNPNVQIVRGLSERNLMNFFWNVRVEKAPDVDDLVAEMKEKLRKKTFPQDSLEQAVNQYAGELYLSITSVLNKKKPAKIPQEFVLTTLENQRNIYPRKTIPFRYSALMPDEGEISACRIKCFYRQLEVIELPIQNCERAIHDYVRNRKERHEWMQNIEVERDELARYDNELFDNWHHEFSDVAGTRSSNKEKSGRELYDSIMKRQSPQLRGEIPRGYVYRGSYHGLADAAPPSIGWHPDWEKHFGTQTAENDVADSTPGAGNE